MKPTSGSRGSVHASIEEDMLKHSMQQITPPIVWNALRWLHHRIIGSPGGSKQPDALELRYRENNAGLDSDTIVLRPGIELHIHPDSREAFEHFCFLSPAMVSEMDAFLNAAKGRNRLLDIGALHGIFSLAFAALSPDNGALAVDASPLAFARLLYNIHKNGFRNIKPVECAISDRSGTLAMHYEWEHLVAAGTESSERSIRVPMNTGDAICRAENFQPDIVKIDVEGHEIRVLQGLAGTIRENSPLVFLEIHPQKIREEGDRASFLESFWKELGYAAAFVSGEPFPLSSFDELTATERLILSRESGS